MRLVNASSTPSNGHAPIKNEASNGLKNDGTAELDIHATSDGAIIVTNSGGSQGFQAGQFGFVPSVNQPPVIVPSNPGIQFTPPPSFSQSSGQSAANNDSGKSAAIDCEVR